MSICCECCVMSGRGLCDELITRPEESYRLWCVTVCDLETSWMRRPWPTGGCRAKNKQVYMCIQYVCLYELLSQPSVCLGAIRISSHFVVNNITIHTSDFSYITWKDNYFFHRPFMFHFCVSIHTHKHANTIRNSFAFSAPDIAQNCAPKYSDRRVITAL